MTIIIEGEEYSEFVKPAAQLMRPYVDGESMKGILVNKEDKPEVGGMIAVNPDNTEDKWYIGKAFMADNYVAKPVAKNISTDGFDFGLAIQVMKAGRAVQRKGWNGKGIFIKAMFPDGKNKMTHPYFYIDTTGLQTDNPDAPKSLVPWLASQTDMWAEDWVQA